MLTLSSEAITPGGTIPELHLGPGHGENISPALRWDGVPAGTVAFALTLTDDDAPGYQHWLAVIDGDARATEVGSMNGAICVGRATRAVGYEGPCPPSGTHHYRFTLHALSGCPGLKPGFTADQLAAAIEPLVLDSAELRALYSPGLVHLAKARVGAVRRRLERIAA